MNKRKLSKQQSEWAWQKWNEGYKLRDIARVLGVCYDTVQRQMSVLQDEGRQKEINWSRTRVLPVLQKEV